MTGRIHICLLTSSRIFEGGIGGEGRYTVSLGNWLSSQNYDVTLMGSGFAGVKVKHLTNRSAVEYGREIPLHKKIKTVHPPYFVYLVSRLLMCIRWVVKIFYIALRHPVSLIHAQDTGYSALAALIAGKLLGVPVLVSSHGIRSETIRSSIHGRLNKILLGFEHRLDTFTINNSTVLLVDNFSIKSHFERTVSNRIDIVPLPIKIKNFEFSITSREALRQEFEIDENAVVIGYVGRFSAEKNLLSLLSSFDSVVQDRPLIRLVFVGEGPLEPQLREYVNSRHIADKVIFFGVRYDIGRVLSSFDIFVLPSFTEGTSVALLEAMAAGRAIVCSGISTNVELVTHYREALIVNPHSVGELEKALRLLYDDKSLRSSLGYNAKNRVIEYDEDTVFPKMLQYYERILRARNYADHRK